MGNVRWAGGVYNAGSWPPNGGQFSGINVALNSAQYSTDMCGKKLMFRGTGQGLGYSPVSTNWQPAMVTNLCPECKYGDLDIGMGGDGRWQIEWYWVGDSSPGLSIEALSASRALPQPKKTALPKTQKPSPQKKSSKSQKAAQPKHYKKSSRKSSSKWKRTHNGTHGGRRLLHASP